MNGWVIEPRDPLVARDGRPAVLGERLRSLGFPYPSVIAGAVRTRLASGSGTFALAGRELEELKAVEVHGPLLVGLGEAGEIESWYFPAPRDAVIEAVEGEPAPARRMIRVRRLVPSTRDDAETRLTDRLSSHGLRPVHLEGEGPPGKPPRGAPRFWTWNAMERWLRGAGFEGPCTASQLGSSGPLPEERVHLALRPGERVGEEGMLFVTSGLRFHGPRAGSKLARRRLALAVRHGNATVVGRELALRPGMVAPIGGERRLAAWTPGTKAWPEVPREVCEVVARTRRARILLATPALFSNGALPGWNGAALDRGPGVRVTVRAACVPRPEIVSGWDFAADNGPGKPKGRPKPTRRLAPAGSTYFVELEGDERAVAGWCERVWLSPVSDDPQDRRDGFGLALVGAWGD